METVSLFGPEDAQRRQAADLVLAEWTNVVGRWARRELLGRIRGALRSSGNRPGNAAQRPGIVREYVRSLNGAVERTAQLRDALTNAMERRSAAFDAVLSQLNRHVEGTDFQMQQLYSRLPPEVREDLGAECKPPAGARGFSIHPCADGTCPEGWVLDATGIRPLCVSRLMTVSGLTSPQYPTAR